MKVPSQNASKHATQATLADILLFLTIRPMKSTGVVPSALLEEMRDCGKKKNPFAQQALFLLCLLADLVDRQKPLGEYCQNSEAEDVIILAFLHVFNSASRQLPRMDLSNQCGPSSAL